MFQFCYLTQEGSIIKEETTTEKENDPQMEVAVTLVSSQGSDIPPSVTDMSGMTTLEFVELWSCWNLLNYGHVEFVELWSS